MHLSCFLPLPTDYWSPLPVIMPTPSLPFYSKEPEMIKRYLRLYAFIVTGVGTCIYAQCIYMHVCLHISVGARVSFSTVSCLIFSLLNIGLLISEPKTHWLTILDGPKESSLLCLQLWDYSDNRSSGSEVCLPLVKYKKKNALHHGNMEGKEWI